MSYRHRSGRRRIFHSAGWLFADLLLALTVIFLAASLTGKSVSKASPVRPTSIVVRTPTVVSTPAFSQGLDTRPLTITINVDPSQLSQTGIMKQVRNQVLQYIHSAHDSNRKVGIVLTFAGGADGVNNATHFNAIIHSMSMFTRAVFKNYHDLNNDPSEFDLEIYFFL